MVTKVTARVGLVAALAALLAGVPASAVASERTARTHGVGDQCLVGLWRAHPAIVPVRFEGQTVQMHYGGGNYLEVERNGKQVINWNRSRLLEAFPNGLPLKLHDRGIFYGKIRGLEGTSTPENSHDVHVLKVTDGFWAPGSSIRATYNGEPEHFHYTQFRAHYDAYTCTKETLVLMDDHLNVFQSYFRRSFTP